MPDFLHEVVVSDSSADALLGPLRWLDEQGLQFYEDYEFLGVSGMTGWQNEDAAGYIFGFKDAQRAMMFKLTWGGG